MLTSRSAGFLPQITMEISTLLLSAAVFIVSFVFLLPKAVKRVRFVQMVNKLPGPPSYPIIGNALEFNVPRNRLFQVFDNRTKQYGDIFRTWLGPIAQISLARPEYVEVILRDTKHLDKSFVYSLLRPWLGEGLVTGTGDRWHSHRKLITPTFHFKILDVFVDVFVEKSDILIKKLQSKMGGKDFDIYPFITKCALDIICESAMGIQMNAQEETHSEYVKAVYEISELSMQRLVRPWMHPNLIFYSTSKGKRYAECLNVLHSFTNNVSNEDIGYCPPGGLSHKESDFTLQVIRKRRASRLKKNEPTITNEEDELLGKKKRLAFLDLLLEAADNGANMSDVYIREEVDTFMFAGHDTTTAGICWLLFLLGSHPKIQDKVYEELDNIFQGSNRSATMRDLNEMKYLERCIKEALRLYPSVPLIGRVLKEDTKI
ncbi:Cytochrome P450 4C1, partial [Periplaneta americana]